LQGNFPILLSTVFELQNLNCSRFSRDRRDAKPLKFSGDTEPNCTIKNDVVGLVKQRPAHIVSVMSQAHVVFIPLKFSMTDTSASRERRKSHKPGSTASRRDIEVNVGNYRHTAVYGFVPHTALSAITHPIRITVGGK